MNFFILFLGVVFCSTSIIFIKKSQIESEYLSAYRTLLSAFLLLPICFYDIRKNPDIKVISYIKVAFIPGLLLSLHFISWIYGARMAEPANSSLIVNLTPLVTPIFLYIIIREKLTFREVLGTTIVMTGVGILAFHDFKESKEYFIGDIICLFSMVFFSIYLIFSRKNKTLTSLWLYVTCLYAWCGLICFCVGLCMQKNPIANIDSNNLLQVFFLAFFTTILGHSLLNYAMKHIRGQLVSIVNQFQFILAAFYGYLFFEKIPTIYFYIASAFLVTGCLIAVYKKPVTIKSN